MADKYRNFKALREGERKGIDFQIRVYNRSSSAAIIAPHGGKIEPNTSDIATAIANDTSSLYCFEGTKRADNETLHITSHNFDEPRCLALISGTDTVVAIHGCAGGDESVGVGGLDMKLRDAIRDALTQVGFKAAAIEHGNLAGTDKNNICNRGRFAKGVQLEITKGLRDRLRGAHLEKFAGTIRNAIESGG
ncbi:MAG TPA: poly-gamma-glutamate hydrolase family protein [Rhizomicrobium sp.]|jgi:phage replication-related protein YjqB (UPF0714/DUF867 family)|nr:poly-gamma-glutamate hydrolase family protein [Rhizomicrobium sp.]